MNFVKEVVQATTDDYRDLQIAVMSNGNPCMAWRNDDTYQVYYAYRDGSGWHIENVAEGSLYLTFAVDSSDVAHIGVWGNSDSDDIYVHYARTGGSWGTVTTWNLGDNSSAAGMFAGGWSLCAIPSGTVVFSAMCSVVHWDDGDGVWVVDYSEVRTLPGDGGAGTAVSGHITETGINKSEITNIGLTPGGGLCVAWCQKNGSSWDLHGSYEGSDTVIATLGAHFELYNPPIGARTTNSKYLLAYTDNADGKLWIATYSGGWSTWDTGLDTGSDNFGFAVNALNQPCVVIYNGSWDVVYAVYHDSAWAQSVIMVNAVMPCALTFSPLGKAAIAFGLWISSSNLKVYYAYPVNSFSMWGAN